MNMGSTGGNDQCTSGALSSGTLSRLVITALERTAFVMAEPTEDVSADENTDGFATRLTFTGAATGECVIVATEGFVRELTAGFLATEPDQIDLATQGQDALNELANIIAGMVIRELGNQTHRIFLGLPAKLEVAAASGCHVPDAISCTLDSCGETLRLYVRLQTANAKAA